MKYIKKIIFIFFSFLFFISNAYAKEDISNKKYLSEDYNQVQMAKLIFGGDVLPHLNFDKYAYSYGNGNYNYDRNFEMLEEFTSDSDLFIVNCEFTSNPNYKPSGYPTFNSDKNIYRSLKNIGVDVITTANNHALDTGIDGLDTTIEAMNSYGIDNCGTRIDPYRKYLIKDINGIRVGILAYTEQINGLEYLLNTKDKKNKIDMIDPILIMDDIQKIRKAGADFVVVYPHWGVEYSSYPESWQINLAHAMIDWGADMVIGNHPHVIQPREEYISQDGRKGMIYYSLGNLVSNQNHKYFNNDYRPEQGLLVETIIYKSPKDKACKILNTSYHNIWTESLYDEYGLLNRTYLTEEFTGKTKKYKNTEDNINYMDLTNNMNYDIMHTFIK
ncbi:CapA family protein [Anaerococcus nagyae]|jgi:hypothetical protein|uniref:CapA family protein n=2 Tax=Anaerococcus nagyae TaxID=1755241 RepID=UPI0032495D63